VDHPALWTTPTHNGTSASDCVAMELAISPADLYAASVALTRCRADVAEAGLTFARRAQVDLPDLGVNVAAATNRGIVGTEQAIHTICTDIEQLSRALAALAHHYPQVDGAAVRRR
jgi:hypothetical protein